MRTGFSSSIQTGISKGAAGMRRAGTIIRSPIEGRQKDKDKTSDGDLRAAEVRLSAICVHSHIDIVPGVQSHIRAIISLDLPRR